MQVILDADPGIDDAIAILLALRSPEVAVRAITTVFGTGPVEQTTRNGMAVLEIAQRGDIEVAYGASKPLTRPYEPRVSVFHGQDGLGDTFLPAPKAKPSRRTAVDVIVSSAMDNPGEITILATGRLTNLALAVTVQPRLVDAVHRVVFMGGAASVPGNASPAAESNVFHDPEAASIVVNAGWPLVMVGLDVTTKVLIQEGFLEDLRRSEAKVPHFVAKIASHYLGARQKLGLDGFPAHDPTALVYLLSPSLFQTQDFHVDVQTGDGPARGATIVDFNGKLGLRPNVRVCLDVDAGACLELIQDRLLEKPGDGLLGSDE